MAMTPERWQRIDTIFNEAAELPAEQRASYVQRAADGDEELIREVLSLLQADATQGLNLDAIVSDAVERADEQHYTGDLGLTLGPYTLVELLGSGGMGSVYKAVRSDDAFTQAVAIKLVRKGMDSEFILARFRQERQILGSLNHPNIARILDAGSSPDGRPYFVMEFVEGLPLLQHCQEGGLAVSQRLQLFLQVCAAVQHAHQKLIIHRDLKPSNIMVTKDGVPKLLDFGIAKILTPGDATGELLTLTTSRMMTPDYASPEQVMGRELTTASDVYSMGALLYLLLSGEKPYRIAGRSLAEMETAVCTVDPKRPSTVAQDAKVRRELAGDLDNIVLHAMSKEPERRYPSPEHFAADIRNYLEGRPVTAREITFLYRIGKTIRRNRTASIAAALLMISLIGGVFSTYYQARRAERRFAQVRKLANTFLFDFYESIEKVPGTVESRALILRTARDYLDSLAAEAGGDESLSLELAQAYLRLGDVEGGVMSGNLGNSQLAARHFHKARELLEPLRRNGRTAALLATVHRRLGDGDSYSSNLPGALRNYEKGIAILSAVKDTDHDSLALLGHLHISMARIQTRMLQSKAALAHTQTAVGIYERLLAKDPGQAEISNALASAYGNLGNTAYRSSQLREALEMHRKSIALREELVRAYPRSPEFRRDLAIAYSNAADVLGSPSGVSLGDTGGALELCRKMAALTEGNLQADPADRRARFDHAMSLLRLGSMFPAKDAEALSTLRQSLAMFEKIAASDPGNRRVPGMVAILHQRMGAVLEAANSREALAHFEKAASLSAAALREDPKDFDRISGYVTSHRYLAGALARSGKCAHATQIFDRVLGEAPGFVAKAPHAIRALSIKPELLKALADAHAACGDHAAAREAYGRSVSAWQALGSHQDFGKVQELAMHTAEQALRKEQK